MYTKAPLDEEEEREEVYEERRRRRGYLLNKMGPLIAERGTSTLFAVTLHCSWPHNKVPLERTDKGVTRTRGGWIMTPANRNSILFIKDN